MNELEIINMALENLQKQTHITGRWEPIVQKNLDGKVILNVENRDIKFNVEIKNELRNHHIQKIITLNRDHTPFMVVVGRLYPRIKDELRNQNIAYLEANGNVYVKNDDILLWIDTNPPLRTENKTGSRAFTKTGLKLVFLFLVDEYALNRTYRQLAEETGIGIGNISNVINGLKQGGFILPVDKNEYKLNNKKVLLEKWATAYDLRLKPTLKISNFRFLHEDDFYNWKKLPLQSGKTWWGGEPAGDLLTNYLRPAELTLYTTETRNELIKNYRLIPDDKGNIKAYQKFWQYEERNDNIVPPLLAYTDLINTNDRRCIETAQKIYDDFLQNRL